MIFKPELQPSSTPQYHGPRLIVDISSLARWTGPPVGIARAEHALAAAAAAQPGTVLSFYDHATGAFRAIAPQWAGLVSGWSGMIDIPAPPPSRWRRLLPSRGPVVRCLERWRLTWRHPLAVRLADLLQQAVLGVRRHRTPVRHGPGQRIARVPPDLALGPPIAFAPTDVLLAAGSGWAHLDAAALARLKAAHGFAYATLCYDLIPLTHPAWWLPEDVAAVRDHWRAHLPLADLVIVNARCIADDVSRFATANGVTPPRTLVLPLGFDPPPPRTPGPPPHGLESGSYALFVSTIEPRKGHATLLAAWRLLLARGLPQAHRFRLLFIGRPGWMVADVLASLADPALAGTVLHRTGIADAELDAAYRHAAFCVYPSAYEGFGLPILEAFARGKPVLASTGGALPETVSGLSPCLPPDDPAAWATAIGDWIERPELLAPWQARIRAGFAHPDWPAAAAAILSAARAVQHGPAPQQP